MAVREQEFGWLDAVCVTLAAEGVALLAVATWVPGFIPVSWAVAVSVATDFLAYLPTFHDAWRRPKEEPWVPYAMFGAAAALVLLVTDYRVLVGVIYPTYLFAADAAMVIMIVASPHYDAAPLPSAGRSASRFWRSPRCGCRSRRRSGGRSPGETGASLTWSRGVRGGSEGIRVSSRPEPAERRSGRAATADAPVRPCLLAGPTSW